MWSWIKFFLSRIQYSIHTYRIMPINKPLTWNSECIAAHDYFLNFNPFTASVHYLETTHFSQLHKKKQRNFYVMVCTWLWMETILIHSMGFAQVLYLSIIEYWIWNQSKLAWYCLQGLFVYLRWPSYPNKTKGVLDWNMVNLYTKYAISPSLQYILEICFQKQGILWVH